ncbi:branched-chain amino acid ABC transporter permease [Noviherbaspirillum sp.]|uniref:branched-chain amino acid ABC transporter permease n=1 Tax=Noviherbaspirillum sp. TaxID=1926288 RepID=UPI002B471D74|nr:branched-chain amino acid ABC transporter permease [Noviherbaspirillum sp.]HJV83342.1 branched-chain amino acid ABC transporter permease [Noviherbaspirillum sp.]
MLSTTVTILLFGVAYGMILYLTSVGLSVTMGLMGFVNLAHGVFAMLGGYVMVTLMNAAGMPFLLALAIACVAVTALGFVLERLLYSLLYGSSELDQVLFSIGLVLISVALARMVWGPLAQPIQLPAYLQGQISLAGVSIPTYRMFLVLFGGLVVAGLWFGFERTMFGAIVRAAVDNRAMAQAIGIDTNRLFAMTFGVGTGLAALGGGLGAEILAIAPAYPLQYIVFFLIVVAVGGLGSIKGPFYAAIIIGLTETIGKYIFPQAGMLIVYVSVFLLLLWRPQGLVGKRRE